MQSVILYTSTIMQMKLKYKVNETDTNQCHLSQNMKYWINNSNHHNSLKIINFKTPWKWKHKSIFVIKEKKLNESWYRTSCLLNVTAQVMNCDRKKIIVFPWQFLRSDTHNSQSTQTQANWVQKMIN